MQIVQVVIGEGGVRLLAGWGALLAVIRLFWVFNPFSPEFHYSRRLFKVRLLKFFGLGKNYRRKYHRHLNDHKQRRTTNRSTKTFRR